MKIKVTLIFCCLICLVRMVAGQIADSTLSKLKVAEDDSNKAILLNQISGSQIYNDPELGLKYANEALTLSQKIGFKRGEADSYFYIGTFCRTYGKLDESEEYYKKAGEIYKIIHNAKGQSSVLGAIGGIYFDRQKYAISLELRFAALKLDQENHDKIRESMSFQNIAIIFSQMKRYEEAETYFKKALKIKQEINDKRGESLVYLNIGAMMVDRSKWNEGRVFFEKALEIQNEIGEIGLIAVCKTNLGNIYMALGKYELSLKYQLEALDVYSQFTDTSGMATTYNGLGALYNTTGNYKEAIKAYRKAEELLNHTENKSGLQTSYYGLHNVYKNTGNYKDALLYHEKVLQMTLDIYPEEVGNKIAELKEQYEAEKREQDILLLEEQNNSANALAEKRKLWPIIIGVSCGFLFIVLILVVIILITRNRHQKRIKEIELVKTKAEFEQKVLRAQMNPHFIFNSLNSIQHYILSNQTQYAYDYLARFSTLIRQVLVNSEYSSISLQKEIELLEIYIELEQRRFQNRFSYEISYDKSLPLDQLEVPVMLVQPFVENAIWHGIMNLEKEKKGHLKVIFVIDSDTLKISVEDNGIGRKAAEKLKKKDEYDSVGMLFSQRRLEMMKLVSGKNSKIIVTDLYNEDGSAKGTKVDIVLPV